MPIYRFVEPRLGQQRVREWRRRALRVVGLIGLLLLVCTVGMMLLDTTNEPIHMRFLRALWNAVNLVTTLGDFSAFDYRQEVFMLVSMLFVVTIAGYAIGELGGILSSAEVVAYRENRSMEHTLERLGGHSVVLGFVGLGQTVAERLRKDGRSVVVIEPDADTASRASGLGYLVIQGDAVEDEGVLRSARIDTASELFVTTGDPHRGLTLTLLAHALNPGLRIAVAGADERWGDMLRRAGASDVIVRDRLVADAMLSRPTGGA